ncbi:MAG: hypothetical protein WBM17_14255 [Anaerolineales bacterium]
MLCRIEPAGTANPDALNAAVASRIQRAGVCWIGTTQRQGQTAPRISVSNTTTTEAEVSMSVKSVA